MVPQQITLFSLFFFPKEGRKLKSDGCAPSLEIFRVFFRAHTRLPGLLNTFLPHTPLRCDLNHANIAVAPSPLIGQFATAYRKHGANAPPIANAPGR